MKEVENVFSKMVIKVMKSDDRHQYMHPFIQSGKEKEIVSRKKSLIFKKENLKVKEKIDELIGQRDKQAESYRN